MKRVKRRLGGRLEVRRPIDEFYYWGDVKNMLKSDILNAVYRNGTSKPSDLSELGDHRTISAELCDLHKKSLVEREDAYPDKKLTAYEYTISEKGEKVLKKFGSYEKFRKLQSITTTLKRSFDDDDKRILDLVSDKPKKEEDNER